jgi:carboxymethylenebutenolidase
MRAQRFFFDADRLAEAGYRALVPDLYRGKVAKAAEEASHMMKGLNFPDAAEQDIRGAVQYLKQSSKKVAVGGFCMGSALTILAAVRVPEMDAGACFYGIPDLPDGEIQKIKTPLTCHFANQDGHWTPTKVDALEAALKQSPSRFEIYRYDAQHAFMNEARPEVYDAASAKLAWERTMKFLGEAMK